MVPKLHFNGRIFTAGTSPDTCPLCHQGIQPTVMTESRTGSGHAEPTLNTVLEVVYRCPRWECGELFIGRFQLPRNADSPSVLSNGYAELRLFEVRPSNLKPISFSQEISDTSPDFVSIFNEANAADAYDLHQICGVGYRKALEFLIKDYCSSLHPDKTDEIRRQPLAKCIKEYVDDNRVVECARRAAWLGNDETHYVRKWQDRDIKDLTTLIRLTVNWIESAILTSRYQDEMPDS